MPLTFAHPAIILPLRYLPKRWVSLTGLVIGSMVPDFEYFMRMRVKSIYSHTLFGLFWFDLPLGLISVLIYRLLIKDKLIDHLPETFSRRFSAYKGDSASELSFAVIAIVCLSVIIGAASHLIWDGFTHPHGYFVVAMPALSAIVRLGSQQVYVYKLMQHSSTLIGLAVIVAGILLLPERSSTKTAHITKYWLTIALVSILTTIARLITGLTFHDYGSLIVTAIAGGAIGLVIASFTIVNYKTMN